MREADEIMVREIYDKSWKLGRVDPFETPVRLERLLEVVAEDRIPLAPEPGGELEGGPYHGWRVIKLETRDRPMYYMMPREAIPLLKPYMKAEDYDDLARRTQRARPQTH